MNKLLTVGMATYDDFDGAYFSIQSLKLYHDIFSSNDAEIIIIDNNPTSKHGSCLQSFVQGWAKNVKYVPYTDKKSTSVRNEIFKQSSGKYTVSMDSHVLFVPGAFDVLIRYYAANPDCKNIIHGPLLYDNMKSCATHFKPTWGGNMYGQWDTDHENMQKGVPFEIPMQGLGVFSCETKYWVGFNDLFKGFGGEEGYIHEKFRQLGGKAICLPDFKWIHRFGRPEGVKYPLNLEDRIWNYFIGWLELTRDPDHQMITDIYNYFKNQVSENNLNIIFDLAKKAILK